MSFERTPYDYEMLRNYNQSGSFNAPPWPTPRSKTDISLQQEWCPNCNRGNVVEGFAPHSFHAAPWPTPRTNFDKALQNRWCPTCDHPMPPRPSPPHPHPIPPPSPYGNQPRRGGTNHLMENYAGVMHTPQGVITNPYQACGNTHSSGPASTPSTREPIQMPMGANPPDPLFKGNYECSGDGTPVKDGCPMPSKRTGNEGCACYELVGGGMFPFASPCQCYPNAKDEGSCKQVHESLNNNKSGDVKAVQCFFNGKMEHWD